MTTRRITELDGFRGLAALVVVCFHYFAPERPTSALGTIVSHGWIAVDAFFALSGYLIVGILLDSRRDGDYFSRFYTRRAFRIFPLYYLVIAVAYGMQAFVRNSNSHLPPAWTFATYTQNFWVIATGRGYGAEYLATTWSLAIEELCYLVLPFLVRFMSRRALAWTFAAMVVALPLSRVLLDATMGHRTEHDLVTRADGLFMGAMLALALRTRARSWLASHARELGWALAGVAIVAAVAMFERHVFGYAKFSVFALLFALMLAVLAVSPEGVLARAFRFRPLVAIGTISYGLYLYHHIVLFLGEASARRLGVSIDHHAMAAACMPVTFGVAAASWRFLEEPLIRFGRQLSERTAVAGEAHQVP